jgi:MFS family permease
VSLVDFEDAPFGRVHWKLAIGATTGYLSDGYTLGVVGIALAGAQSQLVLSPGWLGALGGGSLAGLLVGALFCGPAADRFGRRPIFAYNMIAFVLLSLLQLWVGSAAELLAIRFFLGVVLGTDYVVVKALLAEFMPRLNRGRALSLMGVAWAVGYALAYVAGLWYAKFPPGRLAIGPGKQRDSSADFDPAQALGARVTAVAFIQGPYRGGTAHRRYLARTGLQALKRAGTEFRVFSVARTAVAPLSAIHVRGLHLVRVSRGALLRREHLYPPSHGRA